MPTTPERSLTPPDPVVMLIEVRITQDRIDPRFDVPGRRHVWVEVASDAKTDTEVYALTRLIGKRCRLVEDV